MSTSLTPFLLRVVGIFDALNPELWDALSEEHQQRLLHFIANEQEEFWYKALDNATADKAAEFQRGYAEGVAEANATTQNAEYWRKKVLFMEQRVANAAFEDYRNNTNRYYITSPATGNYNKILSIKALRKAHPILSLGDAKDIVEGNFDPQ